VNVRSDEGTDEEGREEDDDLLRAAEELGIDLSGVRATNGDAADEAEEKIEAEGEGGQVTTDGDYVSDGGPVEDTQDGAAVADTVEHVDIEGKET
jgi:DNA-directed RNA polymerase subunit beta